MKRETKKKVDLIKHCLFIPEAGVPDAFKRAGLSQKDEVDCRATVEYFLNFNPYAISFHQGLGFVLERFQKQEGTNYYIVLLVYSPAHLFFLFPERIPFSCHAKIGVSCTCPGANGGFIFLSEKSPDPEVTLAHEFEHIVVYNKFDWMIRQIGVEKAADYRASLLCGKERVQKWLQRMLEPPWTENDHEEIKERIRNLGVYPLLCY